MTITPLAPSSAISGLPRGNLLLQSQTLGAIWATSNASVSSNTAADIFGLATADTLTRTSAGVSYLTQNTGKAAVAVSYTFSVYAQLKTGAFVSLMMQDAGGGGRVDACFNLSAGALALGPTNGAAATITAIAGTGWYRLTLSAVSSTATSWNVYLSTASVAQFIDGAGSANATAAYFWGAQLEPYASASAYAATTGVTDPGIWAGVQSLPVLPYLPGQDVSVAKGPQWSTQRIVTASGRERTTAYWPYPKWQFELRYGVIRHRPTAAELFKMWEFFAAMQGQFSPWLFVDPSDCQIPGSAPAGFATGDGATRTFQLQRPINSVSEPVYGVYQPVILDNGAPTSSALSFSPNGMVTFATAPASGHALTWFGYFYFGCRFRQDDMSFEQIVPQLWSGKSLKFTSLRA